MTMRDSHFRANVEFGRAGLAQTISLSRASAKIRVSPQTEASLQAFASPSYDLSPSDEDETEINQKGDASPRRWQSRSSVVEACLLGIRLASRSWTTLQRASWGCDPVRRAGQQVREVVAQKERLHDGSRIQSLSRPSGTGAFFTDEQPNRLGIDELVKVIRRNHHAHDLLLVVPLAHIR